MSDRRERADYRGDVIYEVWRCGGNPDAVDYDRCEAAMDRGVEADDFAHRLLREADERRQQREWEEAAQAEAYEHYLREPEPEEPSP